MRWETIVGAVLVVVGVVGLVFGGIRWTEEEVGVEAGPLELRVEERREVPIPPILGGVALAAGAVLLFVGMRQRA